MDHQEAIVHNQSKTLTPKTRVAFGFAALGMAVIGGVYTAMLTKFFRIIWAWIKNGLVLP